MFPFLERQLQQGQYWMRCKHKCLNLVSSLKCPFQTFLGFSHFRGIILWNIGMKIWEFFKFGSKLDELYGPLATNLYRPLPWLLANLSVPWPIRDNFWQHILKEISHIYNISLKLFRLTKIDIIPSIGTWKCKNRIFWTFFSKMEKIVEFGQKFTSGEPNTFKNGSFCYSNFSKKFSLPISQKKSSLKFIDQIWLKNQQKVNFDPIR